MTPEEIKHRMAWLRQEATDGGRVAVGDDTLAEIAEIERLALRYCWLRANDWDSPIIKLGYDEYQNAKGAELDAAVDAALSAP